MMNMYQQQKQITSVAAQHAVSAAIAKAKEIGVDVCAGVVDASGNLVSFLRSDSAPYLSITIAIDKAYTAASFSMSTSEWENVLPQGSVLRDGILNRDRFVGFGGGIPIMIEGECIGAIGVSGASEEQDGICAQAGADAVLEQK